MPKEVLRQNLCHCYYAINHSYSSVQEIIKKYFKKRMERKHVETLGRQNRLWTKIRSGRINADRFNPNRFKTLYLLMLLTNRT